MQLFHLIDTGVQIFERSIYLIDLSIKYAQRIIRNGESDSELLFSVLNLNLMPERSFETEEKAGTGKVTTHCFQFRQSVLYHDDDQVEWKRNTEATEVLLAFEAHELLIVRHFVYFLQAVCV